MADSLDGGEFYLPPWFLSDDDLRFASTDGLGFQADDVLHHMGFFSSDSPLGGLGCFGGSSILSSPSDSDNEDFMTGLTSQLAIADCFKARSLPSSPQSTVCTGGSDWKSQQRSSCGSPGQLSLPPGSWDILYDAAARARLNKSSMGFTDPDAGFYPHPQRLQQETLTGVWSEEVKGTRQQVVQNRNRARDCDFIGGGTGPWPPQPNGYKCAGTGVFLPRPKLTASQTRKKPSCPVLLPARVVQALNLNLDDMAQVLPCPSVAQNGGLGSGLLEHPQGRGLLPRPGTRHDIGLPQDWTY